MNNTTNIKNIHNLINSLKQCGYEVDAWWDASWYCSDNKTHLGIEISIDMYDGDGEPYSLIFNRNGKRIHSCLEGECEND